MQEFDHKCTGMRKKDWTHWARRKLGKHASASPAAIEIASDWLMEKAWPHSFPLVSLIGRNMCMKKEKAPT